MAAAMTTAHATSSPATVQDVTVSRGWSDRLTGAVSAGVGAVTGLAPHVLHHVGPLAGAAIVSGAAGSAFFGVVGFLLTIPLLVRLQRRFGSWLAPGIALVLFAVMFTISTLWIGPAIRDGGESAPDPHDGHDHGAFSVPLH